MTARQVIPAREADAGSFASAPGEELVFGFGESPAPLRWEIRIGERAVLGIFLLMVGPRFLDGLGNFVAVNEQVIGRKFKEVLNRELFNFKISFVV